MNKGKLRGLLMLLMTIVVVACNKDADKPQPVSEQGAPIQITVMFAPGQLGDKGYADRVMEGVNSLDELDNLYGGDSLEVRFISPYSLDAAKDDIQQWASSSAHSFSSGNYERRLLVLTEPFMAGLLTLIKDKLQPTDEILMLKMGEADIQQMSEHFALGNRVHGLNISASASARKYCQYIRRWVEQYNIQGLIQIPVYRLYDNAEYPYRDEMMEAIQEEMGDDVEFVQIGLSSQVGEGIYMEGSTHTVVEAAFEAAQIAQFSAESSGCPFVIVDLGAGNTGWDYYLLSQSYSITPLATLMLDARQASRLERFYINRDFGTAFEEWVEEWKSKAVGAMDVQVTHSDDYYYEDNIYEFE